MGLILDSSVLITAERQGQNARQMLAAISGPAGNTEIAISVVTLVELAQGAARADTPARRAKRQQFIQELLTALPVHPITGQSRFGPGKSTARTKPKGPPSALRFVGNNSSSGQFVLGQPNNSVNRKNKDRLLTVAELYPEIVSIKGQEDSQPSCSAAEALTRQEPFINQNLAYQALAMLAQLLRQGTVSYQGGFCNLSTSERIPLRIQSRSRSNVRRTDEWMNQPPS